MASCSVPPMSLRWSRTRTASAGRVEGSGRGSGRRRAPRSRIRLARATEAARTGGGERPRPGARRMTAQDASGPLAGLRVVEIGAIGPGQFGGMLLANLGADVLRLERSGGAASTTRSELLHRARRSVAIDLKHPDAAGGVLSLVATADVLLEGFRRGVAERLGF